MTNNRTPLYQSAGAWTLLALAPLLLWWVSNVRRQVVIAPTQFVFWHSAVEIFAVVVAMLIFVTGYRAMLSDRKGAVVLLGVAFLGVGLFDFLHTMSYVGMPDAISANSPHKSILFWLAGRILAASALLAYAMLPAVSEVSSASKRRALVLMLLVVAGIGWLGLCWPTSVPAFFVPGQGLTGLKIGLEWLVIGIDLLTLGVLWRRRRALINERVMALIFAAALSAMSELFVTKLGVLDMDGANALGHLYKLVAYLFLLQATFNEALRRPLTLLQSQHQREKLILDVAPDGILLVDQDGAILMANHAMSALTGYDASDLVGQNVDRLLPPGAHARAGLAAVQPGVAGRALPDLSLQHRDGRQVPVEIVVKNVDDASTRHAIVYIRDLTERKYYEQSLRYQATHDELTGLPNRWLFRLQLDQALGHSARAGLKVAVLLLDLDYFKTVNDSFGHATGDALLVQVGQRIGAVLRDNDMLARLGGDEFAVFLSDVARLDDAAGVVIALIAALQAPFRLHQQDVYSGASLGLAIYPDDAADGETLMRYADMAMYQAKQAGRGGYACYSQEMDRRAHEDMQLHTRLKEAMAQGILQLHYQPQVDVQTGALVGVEALLRWPDPVLGAVSPASFIPVAEATGLILDLSDWVLETACRQSAAWAAAGTPLCVAVNFSAQQFRQGNLQEKVAAALARSGAEARWLCIEITESIAMTHPEQARVQLAALVAMGCSVALDDFGTGYSSLAYLKRLPVSKLKIDKSFMDGIPDDVNDVTISHAIIALAHGLGMTLVAEGIETPEQLAFLRQHGCETYQGWLCAKAMSAQDLNARFFSAAAGPHDSAQQAR